MTRLMIAALLFSSIPALAAQPGGSPRAAARKGAPVNVAGSALKHKDMLDRLVDAHAAAVPATRGDRVTVLGAGQLGRGVAKTLRQRGVEVTIHDASLARDTHRTIDLRSEGFRIEHDEGKARAGATHVIDLTGRIRTERASALSSPAQIAATRELMLRGLQIASASSKSASFPGLTELVKSGTSTAAGSRPRKMIVFSDGMPSFPLNPAKGGAK